MFWSIINVVVASVLIFLVGTLRGEDLQAKRKTDWFPVTFVLGLAAVLMINAYLCLP